MCITLILSLILFIFCPPLSVQEDRQTDRQTDLFGRMVLSCELSFIFPSFSFFPSSMFALYYDTTTDDCFFFFFFQSDKILYRRVSWVREREDFFLTAHTTIEGSWSGLVAVGTIHVSGFEAGVCHQVGKCCIEFLFYNLVI